MTLQPSNPRARPRWLALAVVVAGLMILAAGAAFGHSGINSIPSNFFTVLDQQGANDVPGQVDLTQMGRDDTDTNTYRLFWSWDSISAWTGTGQTGDACALFDNDGDTNINFVVCARVNNLTATDVRLLPMDATHPVFLFSCSDAKNDRCTQPSPVGYTTGADAGVLGTLAKTNLITDTDPFPAGESNPHDSTLQVDIAKSLVPGSEVLVNVCSYPSAGNGGNNNPFDCIVSPGGGFLSIVKDAGTGVTSPTFGFSVNTSPATIRSISGSGTATAVPLLVSSTAAVTETTIPSPWALQSVSCTKADDSATGTPDVANSKITAIAIQSGLVTTCTFVDRVPTGTLTVVKNLVNDNGGGKAVTDFGFKVDGGTTVPFDADGSVSQTVNVGTYNVTEDPATTSGYTTSYSGCSNIQITAGGSATCTITNDDVAATLIVNKVLTNDNGGTKAVSDFKFVVNGGTPVAFEADASNSVSVGAGSYTVVEDGTPIAGYDTTLSTDCSGTIANGETKTCTITNNDKKASPTGGTIESWRLYDSISIAGIRSGAATAASVTFRLYSDPACGTQVGSDEVDTTIVGGAASTPNGIAVTASGTYYWRAQYSGDEYNNGFTTACGAEITQIKAKDATPRDDFAP
jgi:Prealbumin-like fold domain